MAVSPEAEQLCLSDLGEREILARILRPRYHDTVGFGDDCAVLIGDSTSGPAGDLVATTDSCPSPLVNLLGEKDPYFTGWLLATINLSDLAAAGATPLGLVVNYTLPGRTTVKDFERLVDGVDACAAAHGTSVVGGDLRDGEPMQLSATAIGRCVAGRRLGRGGAVVGDRLLLIGFPGYLWASALLAGGQAVLPADDASLIRERARRPWAQLEAGQLLAADGLAHAAIDVSDGLYASVRALCEANGLGARMSTAVHLDPVVERVCRQAGTSSFSLAQTWGDWSLLVSVGEQDVDTAVAKLAAASIVARPVGTMVGQEQGITLDVVGGPKLWKGVDQERFSARSWHGADLDRWMEDMLSIPTA